MSFNRIAYNDDTTSSSTEKIIVADLTVNDGMLYKKKSYEQTGEFLTCYANGRATFLPLPNIAERKFALVGIEPLTFNNIGLVYGNGDHDLTLNEDAQCVDLDNIVESRSGDQFSLKIQEPGLYTVTYKITRTTGEKLVKSFMSLNGNAIPGSYGTLPFTDSDVANQSISVSFLVELAANAILKLSVSVYSTPDVGNFSLSNDIEYGSLKSEKSLSFISLFK